MLMNKVSTWPSFSISIAALTASTQFGRPFAVATMANDPPCVPPRILSKLAVYVPPIELVDAYLEEIAKGYNVDWKAPTRDKKEKSDDEDDHGDTGGLKVRLFARRRRLGCLLPR
jgi:hypothetical protein